jgi:GNAT superfamily N-acetyltransferase
MSELISGGRAEGLLAYVEDRLVAWCNVAPRLSLTRLNRRPQFQVEDAERVGSIACFVVAVPYHRNGIARQLLEAACERLARKGRPIAEAYPVKQADADAVAHRGPLRMHLDAGFKPYRETPGSIIVRKDLAPRA